MNAKMTKGMAPISMPAGWIKDEQGRWRRETIHHMGRRLPGWDYRRPGYYVITIVLEDRRSMALGELVIRRRPSACADGGKLDGRAGNDGGKLDGGAGNDDGKLDGGARIDGGKVDGGPRIDGGKVDGGPRADDGWLAVAKARTQGLGPEEIEAKVAFSDLGRAIFDHFRKIGEFTPGLKPIYCAVMPDHLHLLLKAERELARPIGNAIGGFKTGCEKIFAKMGGKGRLFAPGFVDEVILRAGQIHREFNYLLDNPRRLAVKKLHPDLFKFSREISLALWLAPQGQAGQAGTLKGQAGAPQGQAGQEGTLKGQAGAPQGQAGQEGTLHGQAGAPSVPQAPAVRTAGRFSAIGNHFLLARPLAQVQISRRFFRYLRMAKPGAAPRIARDAAGEPLVEFSTPEYERRRDALFAAARRGAVLISPCISDGERQIAREALAAGHRLVTMHNMGFSKFQKPGGRYFDACAEGRLLMLAPAAWPYQTNEKPMTRADATAMNRLCQWLAGDGAATVDYHGMAPADIDRLALEAVTVI